VLSLPGPIVSAAWLSEHAAHPDLRVVDLRWSLTWPSGREEYRTGHVPGAIFLDLDRDLSAPRGNGPGRHPIPDPERLAEVLSARGIGDRQVVVAYDASGGGVASRLWWLFEHFGHPDTVAVLDGGIGAWTAAGGALSTQEPSHPPARWTPHPARGGDTLDADAVEALRHDPRGLLLDVRAPERYRGEVEPVDPRAGHIPGALSAPIAGNLGSDGRFLAPDALRARYAALGVEPGREVAAYCGSGINATQAVLALRLAGLDARLYEGSWSDWSSDPSRPAATGAEPDGRAA
jgi:thiosulfate/3-mercaptopyruvate sulfurtransferase